MNQWKYGVSIASAALLAAMGASAREGASPFTVSNSLHVEFDDNMDQTANDKVDGFKVSDQVTVSMQQKLEQGFLGVSYQLIATWWEPRDDKEFTFDHIVDATVNHKFSPSLGGTVQNKYIRRDSPEALNADGTLKRENSSYDYNALNGSVSLNPAPSSRLDVSGRWQLLRFEDASVADREDYDAYSVGATLVSQIRPETALLLEARGERFDYPGAGKTVGSPLALPGAEPGAGDRNTIPDRGFDNFIGGVGLEQMFSPNLSGRVMVGYMLKDLKAANAGEETSPYAEGSLTLNPTPATTITLMGTYSLYQSGLLTYATQERTAASLSVGHDLTPRFSMYVAGSYANSDYKGANSVDTVPEAKVRDASEDVLVFSARAVYRLDPSRRHSLEAGWSYTDVSSDVREEYDRNRYDVAWRIQL